jgi:hypothetical protein
MVISSAVVAELNLPPISDVHVACEVIDPEVDERANLMVWQEIDSQVQNYARAQMVNPADGSLLGSSERIAADVSAYLFAQAGPKFSNGHTGLAHELHVVYSKRPYEFGNPGTDRSMAFVKYKATALGCDEDNIDLCFLDGGEKPTMQPQTRAIVYSTEEEELNTDPARAIYRYRDETLPEEPINKLCWVDLKELLPDDDAPEACYEEPSVEWGRIKEIDGEQWIVTTILDEATMKMQVVLVELADPDNVVPITGGLGHDPQRWWAKFNPITWYDPATDSYMLVLRQTRPNEEESDIAIWQRQTDGTWDPFISFGADDIQENFDDDFPKTFCLSPEPFVWEGRSYIAFSTSDALQVSMANDGNIWIAKVPVTNSGGLNESRRVNTRIPPQDARRRFEAETFILRDMENNPITPVIYYSMWEVPGDDDINCDYTGDPKAPFEFHTLHRAATGLTLAP